MKRLGSYLQSIRKQHGLSIRSVEKRSKALYPADRSMWVSHTYLRKLEADGYQAPGPNKLKALAAVYRIDYNTILDVAGYRSAEEGHREPRCDFANGDLLHRLSEYLATCAINPEYFVTALLDLSEESLLLANRTITVMAVREREIRRNKAQKVVAER